MRSTAVPTKTMMSVEEYLHTSFEGPDCEYLDGEIVERNIGELPHATIQGRLIYLLMGMQSKLKIRVVPEIRLQIHARRYRVADIAVWREGNIGERIPTVAPLLAIEILSPEDRMSRMRPKVEEYFSIGVEWVWVIDPEKEIALVFSEKDRQGRLSETLTTERPRIQIPLAKALKS